MFLLPFLFVCIINVYSGGVTDSGVCKGSISELGSRGSSTVVSLAVGGCGELVPSGGVWMDFSWWSWSSGWLLGGALLSGQGWPMEKQGASSSYPGVLSGVVTSSEKKGGAECGEGVQTVPSLCSLCLPWASQPSLLEPTSLCRFDLSP